MKVQNCEKIIIFSNFRDLETVWGNTENPSNFQQCSPCMFSSKKNLVREILLDNAKMSSRTTITPGKTSFS